MQISMYSAAVPPFVRILNNLIVILEKAQSHADARKIEPGVLLASRLYPDMYPLLKQVQIATDNAKGAAARLAGIAPPVFADIETTFPELIHRVHKTVAFLQSLTSAQIDGSEERLITLTFPSLTLEFKGLNYLLEFAQPNVHFHITTAYAILRHNGVDIGKRDFLGSF